MITQPVILTKRRAIMKTFFKIIMYVAGFFTILWLGLTLVWTAVLAVSPSFLGIYFISMTVINNAFATLITVGTGVAWYMYSKRRSVGHDVS